ncbi:MAG: ribulose-phosphate 3-epimerase [Saprospiraceae bacterium]|nr:ribulose-phosphate 3-epimerase [Saprospiraceae bacterium]
MQPIIAPSILACDFTKLAEEIHFVDQSTADWVHFDVMDGVFVPNISFGLPILKAVDKLTDKILDVHLMIVQPEKYVEAFREAGADIITVHYEASTHLHRTLQQIKATGAQAGVALNPHTPVSVLFDVLEDVDLVCLMSVNPGFGGQKFIYRTLHKVEELKNEIITRNLKTKIEIDGGVGLQNAEKLLQAGADVLVAGSAIFKAANRQDVITRMQNIGREKMI